MQGICSLSLLLKFTRLPVTLTRQQFSLLPRRKYETVLAKHADLPLEKCPATSPHLSTAVAYLSYSLSGSGRALRISPFLGVHLVKHSLTKNTDKSSSIDKLTSQISRKCSNFRMLESNVEMFE